MKKLKNLVIVESPTKAKTLANFLDKNFTIESSYGHIRDLPKSDMGVDLENNFTPRYVIPTKNRKRVNNLKKLAENASQVYFATDEDREGEAISWHLQEIFKLPEEKIKRIAFHEITKEAILEAIENPRAIDLNMVDAQQARRILDRLVGYELSPFLWRKVAKGLSAGRVQSVAVRLIVEREKEIQNFKTQEYWTIEGDFLAQNKTFAAKLNKINGKSLKKFEIQNKNEAKTLLKELDGATYSVNNIESRDYKKYPLPPFTTSSLQQEANRRFGFSARQTMTLAQMLYEGVEIDKGKSTGLITYMRTDSVNLADKFINAALVLIANNYGKDYLVSGGRRFKTKSKVAQEAHEAIRPTEVERTPDGLINILEPGLLKLYTLIWQRAVASQMAEAKIKSTVIDLKTDKNKFNFQANGIIMVFDGYLKVYPTAVQENELPDVKKGEAVDLLKLNSLQHFTQPPARYSEAGLVKELEEKGIGRPSTYAPTIATIIERKYVEREEKRLKPTEIGIIVNDLLVEHFPKVVDYQFTAKMEDELDEVANGELKWQPMIKEFYLPFKKNLNEKEQELSKKDITEEKTDEICKKCGSPMIIKLGRYGKFLACSNFPTCRNTKRLNGNGEAEEPESTDEVCEKCGKAMVIKSGRYGKFMACSGYPECKNIKNIDKTIGVKCPSCAEGEIVVKRGRGGKNFYACNKYPDCKFSVWSKPTGEKCPDCSSLIIYGKNKTTICSNKACKFKKGAGSIE